MYPTSWTGTNTKRLLFRMLRHRHLYLLVRILHMYKDERTDCIFQHILPLGYAPQQLIIIGVYAVIKIYVHPPAQENIIPPAAEFAVMIPLADQKRCVVSSRYSHSSSVLPSDPSLAWGHCFRQTRTQNDLLPPPPGQCWCDDRPHALQLQVCAPRLP